MNRCQPVAVTGIGCLSAAGTSLDACMDTLFAGGRAPAPPTRFSSTHQSVYPVFEVPQELAHDGNTRKPDIFLTAKLALVATRQALKNAGWKQDLIKDKRVGICIGTTVGSAMNNEAFYRDYLQKGHPGMAPINRYLNSNPAWVIAREYDLDGPCQTIVNACSSGTDAIGMGISWIRSGICDVVIAGGADELCRVTYNGFISLMATDDSPCRPFDANRRGLNLGEGAAVLVLEAEDVYRARKCPARAFILSYSSACDAYHLTAPAPDGRGLKQAIASAMAECELTAVDVAFINAHGTGTPTNDRVESRVIGEMLAGTPFLSTKGFTGHTLGAAGAIEAAFTVACLEAGKIPPSAGFKTRDQELPVSPVQYETVVKGKIAVSQSLAFGGNNSVLIFGRGDT